MKRLNKAGVAAFNHGKTRRNRRGVKIPQGPGWHTSSIAKILCNRAVLGEFQPHRIGNGRRIPVGEPEVDYFPRIIDDQLFYSAQNARDHRRVNGAGRKGPIISNLFSGLVQCAYCDSPIHLENHGAPPKGGKYLACSAASRGLRRPASGELICEATRWRYDHFESSFLAFVQELDLETLIRSEDDVKKRTVLYHFHIRMTWRYRGKM
jgi:hypothetical protein